MSERRRRARLPRGLAVRVALALVAASMLTLVAATLALVPPLEHRIENDRISDLRRLASTARPDLRALDEQDELAPGSPQLREAVALLQRRTGGRIAVFDAAGDDLVSGRDNDPYIRGLQRASREIQAPPGGTAGRVVGDQAVVVAGIRPQADVPVTLVLAAPLDDLRSATKAVRRALPLAAGVALLVAIALAALLSSGLLRRLRRLQADAHALGEVGLAHGVSVDGGDEITEVAGALEAMRVRLVATEADRQAFIATASHELRTPLASLQATLEMLREELAAPGADAAHAVDRADAALRHTGRLTSLATDLLDLSRLDGEAPLRVEAVELRELAEIAVGEARPRLAAQGRELALEGPPLHVLADGDAAVRVLRLLLDNARAHGAGDVALVLSREGGSVLARVTDQGEPLDPAAAEALFARFARGSGPGRPSGFGLGLAIGRGLARGMGGELRAVAWPGGTCFELQLRYEDVTNAS